MVLALIVGGGLFAFLYFLGKSSQSETDPVDNQFPVSLVDSLDAVLMPKISPQEIAQYAANAGWTGDDLSIAVAVALAESGGNPQVYNPETQAKGGTPEGQGSYGLWQVYRKAHPEFASLNLNDPQQNAYAAFKVWQQQGWNAWSTYTGWTPKGKIVPPYSVFLAQAQEAAATVS